MTPLSAAEANALIAEMFFGWWKERNVFVEGDVIWHHPTCHIRQKERICVCGSYIPDYLNSAERSKELRDKLAETWDTNLARATNVSVFALWPKGTTDKTVPPTHIARADTEFEAVVLCAPRSRGVEVEIV